MAGCGVNDVPHLYIGRRRRTVRAVVVLVLLPFLDVVTVSPSSLLCNGVDLAAPPKEKKKKENGDTPGAAGVSHATTLGR